MSRVMGSYGRIFVRNMNVSVPDTLDGCTRVACPEHGCQCPGHTVWLYTCCISRTTQWISTRVFMPEWSSLTKVSGRISICQYHYLELKSGLNVCLKETNCYFRPSKQMFKSATWRELFCVWVIVQIQGKYPMSPCWCLVAFACVCQKYVNGFYLFTNWCTLSCLKNNIKIYITTAPTCFGAVSHTIIRERINLCSLKLQLLKQPIKIQRCVVYRVVVWLYILGPYWCMCVALFGSRLYCRTLQHTYTNKGKSNFDTIHYVLKILLSQYLTHCYSLLT
jgi:hypothetical protein